MGSNLTKQSYRKIQNISTRTKEKTKLPEIFQQRTEEMKKVNVKQGQNYIFPLISPEVRNSQQFKLKSITPFQNSKNNSKTKQNQVESTNIVYQMFDHFLLKPLKQIQQIPVITTLSIWIDQKNQLLQNRRKQNIFRQKKLNVIFCSTKDEVKINLTNKKAKYYFIITSQKMISQIYDLCSQNNSVIKIFLLYRKLLNTQEYKNKYKKITIINQNIHQIGNQIINQKKLTSTNLPFFIQINNDNQQLRKKLKKIRLNIHSMLNFHNKLQAKCDFFHLINYLFLDPYDQKQIKSFQNQFHEDADFDLILSLFAQNNYYSNFINKFLSTTNNPLIIPYIRFSFQKIFNTILKLYTQKHSKQVVTFWKGNLKQQQIHFFKQNTAKCIQLFGFLLTKKNQMKVNQLQGNTLITININQQKRKSEFDFGYIEFSQFKFNSFKSDQILFNALNTFKIVSINQQNGINIIELSYGQVASLLQVDQVNLIGQQKTIVKQYIQQMLAISRCNNHGDFLKAMEVQQHLKYVQLQKLRKKQPQIGFIALKQIQCIQKNTTKYQRFIQFLRKNSLKIMKNLYQQTQLFKSQLHKKIGNIYKNNKQFKLARQHFNKQLKIQIQNFGKNHYNIVSTYYNIAVTYDMQGSYQQDKRKQVVLRVQIQQYYQSALQYFKKSYELQMKITTQFNQTVCIIISNIASIYDIFGQYDQALKWYDIAMKIAYVMGNQNTVETAKIVNNIGAIYQCQSKFDLALQMYEKALNIYTQINGQNQYKISLVLINIANIYYTKNKLKQSLNFYERALEIRKYLYGKKHALTLDILKRIKMIKNQQQMLKTTRYNL